MAVHCHIFSCYICFGCSKEPSNRRLLIGSQKWIGKKILTMLNSKFLSILPYALVVVSLCVCISDWRNLCETSDSTSDGCYWCHRENTGG